MSQVKSEGFTNSFDIGMPKPKASWTIPSGELREYVPKGESIEDVNKKKEELREYFKRNNQIILYAGATAAINYTVPANYNLMIDTAAITGVSAGAASTTATIEVYNSGGTVSYVLLGLRILPANVGQISVTYNNPIKVNSGEQIIGTTAAAHEHTYMITGWLEDKTLLG